jgi:hypothetical protein
MKLPKLTAVLFFLMLFIGQVGYYFIYTIQQHYIKEQAEEQLMAGMPESSLQVIDGGVNKKNIEWKEEDKEFCMDGQLYDVAKIKNVNGKTLIYCLNDKKETQLLQDLSNIIKEGIDQNAGNKDNKHTIKFQLTDYLITEKTIFVNKYLPQKHIGFKDHLLSIITEVNTPPPRVII